MMHHLSIDLETFSSVSIKKAGAQAYLRSPDFEILLFAYSLDGGPSTVIDLACGEKVPRWLYDALINPDYIKHAYNAAFEWGCLSRYMGVRLPPSQWRDTMLHSLYCGYPASLDAAGRALGLPEDKQKLNTGKALIRYFCVPCKATKSNGQRTRNLPHHDPDKWQLFKEYNAQDVVSEMEIERRLSAFPVPDFVRMQWETDLLINDRGVAVDMDFVHGALALGETVRSTLTKEAKELNWPFDMVVLDESSSFKNHQAKRFKALKLVRSKISRIVELTGTPNPRSLLDLWAQLFLLDCGNRLGRTITAYRDTYFVPDKRSRTTIFSYAPKPGAETEIYSRIGDICISMKSEDYLDMPEIVYDDIPVALDAAAQKAYDRLERDTLLQIDDETVITAGTAAVLRQKLLQLCNGACYDEDGNVVMVHNCKMEVLLETVEQLNGQHAIICYNFKHDRARLVEVLKATQLRIAVYEGKQQEDDWNAGKIDLLLFQPASGGYGLNLQDGGHHIIWFGLTDSLELYQQTNKRLHRQGQPFPVIVHHLLVQGGTDEDVIKSLGGKADVQNCLLEALKVRIKRAKEVSV